MLARVAFVASLLVLLMVGQALAQASASVSATLPASGSGTGTAAVSTSSSGSSSGSGSVSGTLPASVSSSGSASLAASVSGTGTGPASVSNSAPAPSESRSPAGVSNTPRPPASPSNTRSPIVVDDSASNSLTAIPQGVDLTRRPSEGASREPEGPTISRSNTVEKFPRASGESFDDACDDGVVNEGEQCDPEAVPDVFDANCCTDNCQYAEGGARCGPPAGPCFNKRRCGPYGKCKVSRPKPVGRICSSNGREGECDRYGRCVF